MEAVLDFGRGCQNLLQSCCGECVGWGGGAGNEVRAAASVIASGWGGGGGGVEVALHLFALHIYVVLFLVPLSPFSILL
jgi:hypothetical protein